MAINEEMKKSVQQENNIDELEKRKFSILMSDYLDDSDYRLIELINSKIEELRGEIIYGKCK